jgi:hypothetical protein
MANKKPMTKPSPRASFSIRLGEDERAALAEAAAAEERQAASLARLFIREGLKAKGYLK